MDQEVLNAIRLENFSTSAREQLYLVSCGEKLMEVNKNVFLVLDMLKNGEGLASIAQALNDNNNARQFNSENLEVWIADELAPKITDLVENQEKKKTFWIQKSIVPARLLSPITNILKFLFHPLLFWPFTVISIICMVMFFQTTELGTLNEMDLLIGYGLFFLSIIFHEFGHLSACRYYGVSHGALGIGVVFYFPVFYADVTNTWRLSRFRRVIVDLGGVYFQLVFFIPVLFLYLTTAHPIYKYCIYLINASFIINMNPFFKFDGYWLLTDAMGVPNLRKRTFELIRYLFRKLLRKKRNQRPFLLGMRPLEKTVMFVYVLLTNSFFAYVFVFILPHMLLRVISTFPEKFETLRVGIGNWLWNNQTFPEGILVPFLINVFIIITTLTFVYKLLKKVILPLRNWFNSKTFNYG